MKIRIIELFNMINEKKEIPQKIKYENNIYVYSANDNRYHQITKNYPNVDAKDLSEVMGVRNFNYLYDCAEIIEEPKKIEKLKTYKEEEGEDYFANILKLSPNSECEIDEALSTTIDKLNELIDEINNLKEK